MNHSCFVQDGMTCIGRCVEWLLDDVGERPAAAAGGTARSNDGAVGRWMGISSAQSVTTCCHFVYFVLHLRHFL